ncbi:receptor-interacting serine/threonine-protein kinase 1 [Mixophyes fleayi]|uniref:receptor-interacting serine/threonine-protein kinase 1 n=1 Tax=Mixophyes fleayi TaxID=3061075 RepID=UPI003F4DA9C5
MESQTATAEMSLHDITMSSKDLIDKEEIDSGGFGQVYLCRHRTRGLVVLKTVFTGLKHNSYNKDLLEEGEIMYKLNHERVVKLLGIILEDGNYALVIEYMPKGNLLSVLKQITVADSVKARFILEIIEGMVYLHDKKVVHKDLKPENILANDEFHIKIADLGVAAFQKWSTLTKEETVRQRSRSRSSDTTTTNNAGTLSYMAPEHLKYLNKKATEKSDVYSFGIVIWVILNNKEPYENAINASQISHCVIDGQRPEVDGDLNSVSEATDLMQECWKGDSDDRPSFKDCENTFRPVYTEIYEKCVDSDLAAMKSLFPKPELFIERMASLQIDCDAESPSMPSRDHPHSLHSSLGLTHGNVNESLFGASTNEPVEHEHEIHDEVLERKLQDEMNYHQSGSRIDNGTNLSNPQQQSEMRSRKVFNNPFASTPSNAVNFSNRTVPNIVHPADVASGYTYDNVIHGPGIYVSGAGQVDYPQTNEHTSMFNLPPSPWDTHATMPPFVPHHYDNGTWQQPPSFEVYNSTKVPVAESMPSLYPQNPNYSFTGDAGRQGGVLLKGNFGYPQQCFPESSVNLTISNSKAIQIGNNNVMTVEAETVRQDNQVTQSPNYLQYQLKTFENNSLINENQLQLLRLNLSRKWKEFARNVGFRQPEIDEIDHDYERDGLKEKVYQMLHKWQMREGSKNATVGKVATALHSLGETDLLNQLIQLN